MPFPALIPLIAAGVSAIGGLIGQGMQKRHNMKLAQFQASANEKYLQQQLQYNSPVSQMTRFQEAGLNPNLIYGQGNPGNQNAPLQHPDIRPVDMQGALANLVPVFNQTMMMQSQTQAMDANTRRTHVLTELNQMQKHLLSRNPLIDEAGFRAIINSLVSSAEIKAADSKIRTATADWFSGDKSFKINGVEMHGPAGVLKLETELKLLEQRFNLGALDQKLKAEVLQSKEFQNAILEVQKKWMTDAEITPQHIYQFIQMLILKLF